MNHKLALVAAVLATGCVVEVQAATATFIVSNPYLQFSDSPFASFATLEDFEDGSLAAGVSASAGSIKSSTQFQDVDSVDGDDGVIDGNGSVGHSWDSGYATSVTFTFDAGVLGQLPTHVGVVWTDIGSFPLPPRVTHDDVLVRAFDAQGNSIGFTGADGIGDYDILGNSAEDVFFGTVFLGGIKSIQIVSLGSINGGHRWEIDHLQFGVQPQPVPVPVPAALVLFGSALAGLTGLRRRRA